MRLAERGQTSACRDSVRRRAIPNVRGDYCQTGGSVEDALAPVTEDGGDGRPATDVDSRPGRRGRSAKRLAIRFAENYERSDAAAPDEAPAARRGCQLRSAECRELSPET